MHRKSYFFMASLWGQICWFFYALPLGWESAMIWYIQFVMKKIFWAAPLGALLFASRVVSAEVPSLRLLVAPLKGQSLAQCESTSVSALRSWGFQTQELKQEISVFKIWETKQSSLYSIQIECDAFLQTKAVAFSHPTRPNTQEVVSIINTLFRWF